MDFEAKAKEIQKIARREKTYLRFDGDENGVVTFSTRRNGSVGAERPGKADIAEARKIARILKDELDVTPHVQTFDEWTILEVEV